MQTRSVLQHKTAANKYESRYSAHLFLWSQYSTPSYGNVILFRARLFCSFNDSPGHRQTFSASRLFVRVGTMGLGSSGPSERLHSFRYRVHFGAAWSQLRVHDTPRESVIATYRCDPAPPTPSLPLSGVSEFRWARLLVRNYSCQ